MCLFIQCTLIELFLDVRIYTSSTDVVVNERVPGIEPVSCMVLYIPSSQTDYIMVFYLQSLLLFAFLHLFIASSNRGGLSHTQSIQSAVISREWVGFTLAWVLSTTDTWCNSQ